MYGFYLICVTVLLVAGCDNRKELLPTLTLNCEISPQPVLVGQSTITVSLLDAAAKPVSGAHVQIEADMSHAGMAPIFSEAREAAPGSYRGSLKFTMAGDWVIFVSATTTGGTKIERRIDVRGVQPG